MRHLVNSPTSYFNCFIRETLKISTPRSLKGKEGRAGGKRWSIAITRCSWQKRSTNYRDNDAVPSVIYILPAVVSAASSWFPLRSFDASRRTEQSAGCISFPLLVHGKTYITRHTVGRKSPRTSQRNVRIFKTVVQTRKERKEKKWLVTSLSHC